MNYDRFTEEVPDQDLINSRTIAQLKAELEGTGELEAIFSTFLSNITSYSLTLSMLRTEPERSVIDQCFLVLRRMRTDAQVIGARRLYMACVYCERYIEQDQIRELIDAIPNLLDTMLQTADKVERISSVRVAK